MEIVEAVPYEIDNIIARRGRIGLSRWPPIM